MSINLQGNNVTVIGQLSLNVMHENEQMYKSIYSEIKYHQTIVNLMNKMPGMGTRDATGPVKTLDDENNDMEILDNSE